MYGEIDIQRSVIGAFIPGDTSPDVPKFFQVPARHSRCSAPHLDHFGSDDAPKNILLGRRSSGYRDEPDQVSF